MVPFSYSYIQKTCIPIDLLGGGGLKKYPGAKRKKQELNAALNDLINLGASKRAKKVQIFSTSKGTKTCGALW
jgi:hypothetical protein